MKVFNLLFFILFVVSAVLQYNDPDPFLWIPIYLVAAAACWLGFRGKFYPKIYLGVSLVYLVYALILFFEKDGVIDWMTKHNAENIAGAMKAETPWIEDTREFFGLVIMIAVLMINYFYDKRKLIKA